MVLMDGKETTAVVGNRPIRIGESLEGLRVISITSSGVTLADQQDK